MKAVVVAHGTAAAEDAGALDGAALVVAADGGALALERWGRLPDAIVGDLDSLGDMGARSFSARGVAIHRAPREKDETDLELAVAYAKERGADEIVVLGAFGGERLDYDAANALLLVGWGPGVRAVRGGTTFRAVLAGGELRLDAAPGDRVSIVAASEHAVVGTEGLRYPLRDEPLALGTARGLSNEITRSPAVVRVRAGAVIVIHEAAPRGAREP